MDPVTKGGANRSGILNKKRMAGLGIFAVIVFIVLTPFILQGSRVKQIPFTSEAGFARLDSSEQWSSFSHSLNISERKARIEDFKLIFTKQDTIHSIRFGIVEQTADGYTNYQYHHCFSCELEEENGVRLTRNSSKEYLQYSQLLDADAFFEKLDQLKASGLLENSHSDYTLLVSSGWDEGIGLEGTYYDLTDGDFKEVDKDKHGVLYSGYNIQVIENDSDIGFETNEAAKTVFIGNFKEEENVQ